MNNISFIIPCGRIPFEKAGKNTVDSILSHHPDAEILVSSKEKINYKNIIYIEENKDNIGAVKPINEMANKVNNDFICLLNDDYYINDNITPVVEDIIKNNLIGLTLMPYDWHRTGYGNIPSFRLDIPLNVPNMPFPVIRTDFVIKNEALLYPKFIHGYADSALAFILKTLYKQNKIVFDNRQIYVYDLTNNKSLNTNNQINLKDFEIYKSILGYPQQNVFEIFPELKTPEYLKFTNKSNPPPKRINKTDKPKLSILMPGIKHQNWYKVYQSISYSTQIDFELIIVSPRPELPDILKKFNNVKYFEDFGSPMRCAQIAACLAEGEILFLMSDDGVFLPQTLDQALTEFNKLNYNIKNVLTCKYYEGPNKTDKIIQPNEYYELNYHDSTRLPCIPDSWIGFNNGLIYREYFQRLGGWDCRYETESLGLADLAIRIQRDGGNLLLSDIIFGNFDWYPTDKGDHAPIYKSHTEHDEPLYKDNYKHGYQNLPINIDILNWKQSDKIWKRRW